MTTQQLVTLMNELACLSFAAKAAALTALNHPTVENVQRAIALDASGLESFIGQMFDNGCPILFEAPLWLHAFHGATVAALEAEADAMAEEVAVEAALSELVAEQVATVPLTAVDVVLDTPVYATPEAAAVGLPMYASPAAAAAAAKAFRVVRLRDGVVAGHVTRALTLADCQTYLATKGTKSLAILDVATGAVR
jgi:hypothetical protein